MMAIRGQHYIAVPFEEGGKIHFTMPAATSTPRATPSPENLQAIPWGIRLIRKIPMPRFWNRLIAYRANILILTYIFYVTYHLARRPLGVVKNVLKQSCVNMTPPHAMTECELRNGTWCAWQPFDHDSQKLFSFLDFTYRLSYAIGMIISGHIAERTNLRLFITAGMLLSGLFAIFNGMAYFWQIHAYSFFIVAQLLGGLFQGTGWPSVVPLMGNWFGKHRLGFIFGVWNSHTSVGNILGAVIAGVWVNYEWGFSFIVPGLIIAAAGVLAFFFVVEKPEDVGLEPADHSDDFLDSSTSTEQSDLSVVEHGDKMKAKDGGVDEVAVVEKRPISMWEAIKIPGVVEYSFCLFFSKAVYYTFFFWLPVYIKDTSDGVDNHYAADLSAVFDAGGILGGIIAGAIVDATHGSATVCGAMFILAIPSLMLMMHYVSQGLTVLIILLIITGLFVNGPYALITTVVSTELGTRPSLVKSTKALATVTAVIDGMGSLGSAVGPMVAGLLSIYGWRAVFYFLVIAQIVAMFCLVRLVYKEILMWREQVKRRSRNNFDLAAADKRNGFAVENFNADPQLTKHFTNGSLPREPHQQFINENGKVI